jgi:UDP-glucose 4-epimerase
MNGKVLVTGGFGNLGAWVTRALYEAGYEVFILTRKETQVIQNCKYKVIEADITNFEELDKQLNIIFDYCIHMASYNEFFEKEYAKKAIDVNVLGTKNLLKILVQNNIGKFIYLSTVHVYGDKTGMVREDDELFPQNDYAMTHLFAEYYVKQYGITHQLTYTILRLTNSYGSPMFRDTSKWYLVLNDLAKNIYEHQTLQLHTNGNASRDFIWMGDVVEVIKSIMSTGCQGTYNLSSMQNYTILEIANMIQLEYEKRYNKRVEIFCNKKDKQDYQVSHIDNSKLQQSVAYKIHNQFSSEINKIFDLLESKHA